MPARDQALPFPNRPKAPPVDKSRHRAPGAGLAHGVRETLFPILFKGYRLLLLGTRYSSSRRIRAMASAEARYKVDAAALCPACYAGIAPRQVCAFRLSPAVPAAARLVHVGAVPSCFLLHHRPPAFGFYHPRQFHKLKRLCPPPQAAADETHFQRPPQVSDVLGRYETKAGCPQPPSWIRVSAD